MKIRIPFNEWSKRRLMQVRKTATSRNKVYGEPGDFFEEVENKYVLMMVKKLPLWFIADALFASEGCESPDEFRNVWCEIHPRKGWDGKQEVFYHYFKRVS